MTTTPAEQTMVSVGSAVRAIDAAAGDAPGTMRVGGYLVPFTDEKNKDLYDTFWTDDSYLGARAGDGQDAFVHHAIPLGDDPQLEALAEYRLKPLSTRVDKGIGLWAETVLDLSDAYEAAIAEMVRQGRLSWSSATAAHLMRVEPNGWVRSWPIIEGSLTPTPGTPFGRTRITTLRALLDAAIPQAPAAPEATPTRALTGSPSEIIWTCYQCCLACAAVCRSCAAMCSDTAAARSMHALAMMCDAMAASCLECYYTASGEIDAELVALCLAACGRCCRTCVACCTWCADHASDPTSAESCRACAAMCLMCAEACEGSSAEGSSDGVMTMRSAFASAFDALPAEIRAAVDASTRAGAVLSAKNYALVETIATAATALLAAATKEKGAERTADATITATDAQTPEASVSGDEPTVDAPPAETPAQTIPDEAPAERVAPRFRIRF